MSPAPLISASHLHITRNQRALLDNVSLDVHSQDFITIIGPNGAGKSLLIKCLMHLQRPDTGQVLHADHLKIGYVPQRLVADATLPITAKQFLTLAKPATRGEIDQVVSDTKISAFLETQLHVLSGGELQRLLLARALLNNPNVLILDEPAQNLDLAGQLAFYDLLNQLYITRNISIVMVSHDLHLVMRSTRKVICLYHHICCEGKPEIVTQHPSFTHLFGDHMARMITIYNHQHDHHH